MLGACSRWSPPALAPSTPSRSTRPAARVPAGARAPRPGGAKACAPPRARLLMLALDAGGPYNLLLPFAQRQRCTRRSPALRARPRQQARAVLPALPTTGPAWSPRRRWSRAAGGRARSRSAARCSTGRCRRAGDPQRRRAGGGEPLQPRDQLRNTCPRAERVEQEIGLQIGLNNAQVATLGFGPTRSSRRSRGPASCAARSATRATCSPVLFGLGQHYVVRAQLDVARELADKMLVFAPSAGGSVPLLVSHRGNGHAAVPPG